MSTEARSVEGYLARLTVLLAILALMACAAPAAPAAPSAPLAPAHLEGRITLRSVAPPEAFVAHRDDYNVASQASLATSRLPDVSFELLQLDQVLVPAVRGSIPGEHPYWEFILAPGSLWQEPGDNQFSRAALPFTLQEVNANCMHHGVLSLRYHHDGRVSQPRYEISSETCGYFKFDMKGELEASYTPYRLAQGEALASSYRLELAARLPRRTLAELARDYPGVDVTAFAHAADVAPEHLTTWGVIVDGIHYAGGCPTRTVEYPFCGEMHLPSYSLAKSMYAGFALAHLEKLLPGTRNRLVADLVPECRNSGSWNDVTLENLLDMTSGNYQSAVENADEHAQHADQRFFMPATHAEKIDYACNFFPRRAAPGERFVYRSSDTYILGVALAALIKEVSGPQADLVADLLWPEIWREIGLDPAVSVVRRTRDELAQPFTGYGLTLTPDDVAKLAAFLNPHNARLASLLDPAMMRAALQRNPADRGLVASADGVLYYNKGYWALRVDSLPGCSGEQYIPFMAGYGGIVLALLPNGVSYYYFSDNHQFSFRRAIAEAAKIRGYCAPNASAQLPGNKGRSS